MASIPVEQPVPHLLGERYDPGPHFDEMFDEAGRPRPHYAELFAQLVRLSVEEFEERRRAVDASFLNQGIGFTVYDAEDALERIFPVDLIPRVIPGADWQRLEQGLAQRVRAHRREQDDSYVRVAVGRDYADVPPTRGVFKGGAEEALSVRVSVEAM